MNLSSHYLKAQSMKPWERKVTLTNTKRKTKKKIVHEIFKKCAEEEESEYWKNIFTDASVNKFRPGYSFKNNILMCKVGNQTKELSITEDIDAVLEACKEFFNKNSGLISPDERENDKKERNIKKKDIKEITWDKLKKDVRITLLYRYIDQLAIEKELNEKEKQELINFINYHLILKNLNSSHFKYEKGMLLGIDNISFDSKERLWTIKTPLKSKRKDQDDNQTKTELYWKIYPIKSNLDKFFIKQVELIFKPKISNYKFIPQSYSSTA